MTIHWEIIRFEDLTPEALYKAMQLRAEVFIVEQNCPYQDPDGKDLLSFHVLGYNKEKELLAYCRILPENISYSEISIGRVVTSPKIRGKGAGKLLMDRAIEEINLLFGEVPIKIGAQLYLKKFYEGFGFEITSDEYLEDNIPHVEMVRKA
ncbi:MAG TPA: GNAT family N-acetyltransferase [Bacteroidia bacterium]|jgi:ElaA protein